MSGKKERRLFAVDEVNELIPRLEMIMQRLQLRAAELRQGLKDAASELGEPPAEGTVSALVQERPELRALVSEMEDLVGEIEALGGEFKGLDLGLVDFPAEVNGELALLCWQYGEKEVAHWHPLEGGFSARQLLPAGSAKSLLQ